MTVSLMKKQLELIYLFFPKVQPPHRLQAKEGLCRVRPHRARLGSDEKSQSSWGEVVGCLGYCLRYCEGGSGRDWPWVWYTWGHQSSKAAQEGRDISQWSCKPQNPAHQMCSYTHTGLCVATQIFSQFFLFHRSSVRSLPNSYLFPVTGSENKHIMPN